MGVVGLRSSFPISLFLHACLIAGWILFFGQRAAEQVHRKVTWIELAPQVVPVPQKQDPTNSRRIVQTARGQDTQVTVPNSFLGERNQIVDHQTVSVRQQIEMGKDTALRQKEKARQKTLSRLGLAILPESAVSLPERDGAERALPGDLPHDYVKGMKESERTALNTKEYVFYGYFQRIRERLDLAWTGGLRARLVKFYRAGRQLASDADHVTRLLVTLNQQGEIVRVQVVEESGVRDLDDAAINAFNQSGPFPNPPRGIVDKNGYIQIRWDFVLKT